MVTEVDPALVSQLQRQVNALIAAMELTTRHLKGVAKTLEQMEKTQ